MKNNLVQYLANKFDIPVITAEYMLLDWDIKDYGHFSILSKKNEVHMLLHGSFMPREGFRKVFCPILSEYGKVVTRCHKDDQYSIEFVERIGFTISRFIDPIIHYEIDYVPFQTRRMPCLLLYH